MEPKPVEQRRRARPRGNRRPGGFGQDRPDRATAAQVRRARPRRAVVTNDLVTREDAERLKSGGLIDPERVMAVEAGACPHTVIREDPTLNMEAADHLESEFGDLDLILIESGGDNLASTFSLDLVDYWLFVIDVAGGDDIPRKRGPGIVQSDILVINKTDLAPYVGSDLDLMRRESGEVRGGRTVIFTNCKTGEGIEEIIQRLKREVLFQS